MVVPKSVTIDYRKFTPKWDENGEFAGVKPIGQHATFKLTTGSMSAMDAAALQDDVQARLEAILPTLEKTSADMLPAKQLLESGFLSAQQIVQLLNAKLGIEATTPGDGIAALEGYERARDAALCDTYDTGLDAADWTRKGRPSSVREYLTPSVRPMSVGKYLTE
jgi:hypothetical protein